MWRQKLRTLYGQTQNFFNNIWQSKVYETYFSAADGGAAGRRSFEQQELPALQNPDRQADQVDDPAREGHCQLEAEI